MEYSEIIRKRFSTRSFSEKEVEQEKLDKVIEAGMLAPTAQNRQPQRIYVIKSREALEKIRSVTKCAFNAPVVLMVSYNETEQWTNDLEAGVHSGVEDAAIAATHMMLEATDQGLSTCWVNWFSNTKLEEVFAQPENERTVLIMPLGYAAENAKPTPMHERSRDAKEIVRYL